MNKASVVGKIIATGTLKLLSPLLIGNGSQNEHDVYNVDMPVVADKDGNPFIPATSLAGVLRDIVWNLEKEQDKLGTAYIFGTSSDISKYIKKGDIEEQQSMISVNDIILENAKISNRDGVSIEAITGVAKKHHKYDFEVVERGATGNFYIEITVREYHKDVERNQKINNLLSQLWSILSNEFSMGAMTSKGFGRVYVENLIVDTYDFKNNKDDVIAWLNPDNRQNPLSHKIYRKGERGISYPQDSFDVV